MSTKTKFPFKNSLVKIINNNRIYCGKGFDLTHGFGYFVHIYPADFSGIGFGYSKLNVLQAVRRAFQDLHRDKMYWNNFRKELRRKLEKEKIRAYC